MKSEKGLTSVVPSADAVGNETLGALVTRMAAGDDGALALLYDLTIDRIYAIALRVLNNRSDAEEAVCDCYRQVWESAAQYAPARGSVLAWMTVMAHTRSIDLRRRRALHSRHEARDADEQAAAYPDPDALPVCDLLDAMTVGSAVHRALSELTQVQRELIRLAFIEDRSHVEIVECTGLPLGTVKSHIRRGLLRLRECLGERV